MNNEERLILGLILLLAVSISAYTITSKHLSDLNSYSELLTAKRLLEGNSSSAGLIHQITASLYRMFSSGDEFNYELFTNVAKVLTVILSAACAVSFYFMLRQMFSDVASMGGAVLLVSSQAFLLNMESGVYSPDSLGMCLFALACASLFIFYSKKNHLLLLASALLFLVSALSWNAGWILIGILLLSLTVQLICQPRKWDDVLARGVAALIVVFIVSYLLTSHQNIFKEADETNLLLYLPNVPLAAVGIAAFALHLAGRHKSRGRFEFFAASFFLLSVFLSVFAAFPSSLGIALFSAFAINELFGVKDQNTAIAVLSIVLFFASFEYSQTFLKTEQAALASFLIALTSVFIASLYREKRVAAYIIFSVIALSLLSSLSTAAIIESQRIDRFGTSIDDMLTWVKDELHPDADIWAYGISPLLEFTTGRSSYYNDTEFARFILSNDSAAVLKQKNITYAVLDASLFDNIEEIKTIANNSKVRIDSFRLYRYEMDTNGNIYAVFVSRNGNAIFAQADPMSGSLLEGDVLVVGADWRKLVPLKKLLRIGNYRLVYPQDNYDINLFRMFFEHVDGMKEVYTSDDGEIKVFEVL